MNEVKFEKDWKEKRETWLKALGEHIRNHRKKKGFKTTAFSDKLNMDRSNYLRLERGDTNPNIFLIKKICDLLGMSQEKFWKGFKE